LEIGSTDIHKLNLDGEVVQHVEYVPFGEVFIEERNSTWNTPYLFNGKEFDEETGLYYYGARYYDARLSLWMSVDPISNYDPLNSENYLDGEHNGGVRNHYNLNPYIYCYQNPVKLSDPDGKQVIAVHGTFSSNKTWQDKAGINRYTHKTFGNNSYKYGFNWSGGNYASMRTTAAKELIQYAINVRRTLSNKEPLTIVEHSHGGNVGIEAINMMVNMPEFDGIQINLLTINTPVRNDYQLSKKIFTDGNSSQCV
jgi:RHS repeat-associated protein